MKISHLVACSVLILFSVQAHADEDTLEWTAGWRNGRYWNKLPVAMRGAYLVGLTEAVGIMAPDWGHRIAACRCTFADLVAGIDALYARDPSYVSLPVFQAMAIYLGRTTGDSWEKIDEAAQRWLEILASADPSEPLVPVTISASGPCPAPLSKVKPADPQAP